MKYTHFAQWTKVFALLYFMQWEMFGHLEERRRVDVKWKTQSVRLINNHGQKNRPSGKTYSCNCLILLTAKGFVLEGISAV